MKYRMLVVFLVSLSGLLTSPACLAYTPSHAYMTTIDNYRLDIDNTLKQHCHTDIIYPPKDSNSIDDSHTDYKCPYYHSRLQDNVRNRPVAAVGIWIQNIDFWYDSEFDEQNNTTKLTFSKIQKHEHISDQEAQTQFYYKDNQLVYYMQDHPQLEYPNHKVQLYFQNNQVVIASPKEAVSIEKDVLAESKLLMSIPQLNQ